MKQEDEEKLAFPELKMQGVTSDIKYERALLQKILMHILVVNLEQNPDVTRKIDDKMKKQIRVSFAKASFEDLEKRLQALQLVNPGAVIEGFKRAGYEVSINGAGEIDVVPSANNMSAGSYVSEEQVQRDLMELEKQQ